MLTGCPSGNASKLNGIAAGPQKEPLVVWCKKKKTNKANFVLVLEIMLPTEVRMD